MAYFPWTANTSQLIFCEFVFSPGWKTLWTPGESGLLHIKTAMTSPLGICSPTKLHKNPHSRAAPDLRSQKPLSCGWKMGHQGYFFILGCCGVSGGDQSKPCRAAELHKSSISSGCSAKCWHNKPPCFSSSPHGTIQSHLSNCFFPPVSHEINEQLKQREGRKTIKIIRSLPHKPLLHSNSCHGPRRALADPKCLN